MRRHSSKSERSLKPTPSSQPRAGLLHQLSDNNPPYSSDDPDYSKVHHLSRLEVSTESSGPEFSEGSKTKQEVIYYSGFLKVVRKPAGEVCVHLRSLYPVGNRDTFQEDENILVFLFSHHITLHPGKFDPAVH